MTSRNLVKLFMTTLLVGGVTTAIVGFIIRWNEFQPYFTEFKIMDILSTLIWLIAMGFLFSLISQMGFFSYLTIHRFGLGIFKSVTLWNGVQVVLILFGLFDLVYLRYITFAKSGNSILPYVGLALFLFIVALIVAGFKMKQTNRGAFIPALFFMTIATLVEWVPALKSNSENWLLLMLVALLACNTYQLLILHKLNTLSEQERQSRASQAAAKVNKISKKPSM